MRTTINLDDDILTTARSIASEEGRSLGEVVSDLVRRALAPDPRTEYRGRFPVFQVRENAPPLTPEMVEQALEER